MPHFFFFLLIFICKKRKKEAEESVESSVEDMECSDKQTEEATQTRKLNGLLVLI